MDLPRPLRKIVTVFGSLQLAMILLLTIALAIGTATIMESKFTTEVARYYIYRAPWFTGWLILLCLNLFCAAFTRWPWKRRHLGFVITHAGIITLLIGAMIGRWAGFEAFITLHKGEVPQNQLISQETILTVQSARDGGIDRLSFPVEGHPPNERHPRLLSMPDTKVRLKVDDYTEHLIEKEELVASDDPAAPAGVALHFSTQAMKQDLDANLFMDPPEARKFDFFTLARVELVPSLSNGDEKKSVAKSEKPFSETQVIFAAHPDQPVIDSSLEKPSHYQLFLVLNPARQLSLRVVTPHGTEQSWTLEEAESKTFSVKGDPTQITVVQYWPDFAIRNEKPVSLSLEPRNPALLVRLIGPASALVPAKSIPLFRIALAGKNKINYQLLRDDKIVAQGELAEGENLALGWADWQAHLKNVFPHSSIHRVLQPAGENQTSPFMKEEGTPAIHTCLVEPNGTENPGRWIMSGMAEFLPFKNGVIRIGFGQKPILLPFSLSLENFSVPRDEGTDTPADFISSLRFDDFKGNVRHDKSHMNYPAMYPGGFWRSVFGWNYKFSQSSWNPDDLNETTLQVLYDPGWPAKWIGSLMICLGIATMFYFKPRAKAKLAVKSI